MCNLCLSQLNQCLVHSFCCGEYAKVSPWCIPFVSRVSLLLRDTLHHCPHMTWAKRTADGLPQAGLGDDRTVEAVGGGNVHPCCE